MSMMKCPECGNEISDTAKTCPKCGYQIKVEATPEPSTEHKSDSSSTLIYAVLAIIFLLLTFYNASNLF